MTKPTPQSVRESLVAEMADVDRKRGIMPRINLIERLADKELQAYEAREREKRRAPPTPRKPRRASAGENSAAHELARTSGVTFYRREAPAQLAKQYCHCGICKLCKLSTRITALVEQRPGSKPGQPDFFYPQYAHEILIAWSYWFRGNGPYAGLKKEQQDRKLARDLEDIADKSSAVPHLGGWWVK